MKVVKKKLIEQQNKLKYIFTERNLLIEVFFVLPSLTTLLSSKLWLPSRTRPSSTSSWSTVQEVSFITYLPLRKNSQKNSTCLAMKD